MTGREAFAAAFPVSRETLDRLAAFVAELERWNRAINLVSRGTLASAWTRHVLDSAQVYDVAGPGGPWADIGSGGGLPGLVCAILAAEAEPERIFHLVESDARKAAFLVAAARSARLSTVRVHAERAEALAPLAADIVSARALAPLADLLPLAQRHLRPGGRAVFPKGAGHLQEIAAALETWRFRYEKHPSRTEPGAVLLVIGDIEHV